MPFTSVAVAAALLASGPIVPSKIEDLGWNQRFPRGCDVELSFGSYARGTDREVGDKVRAYIERSRHIPKAWVSHWGREGEYGLCLNVKPARQTGKVYADLKRMIPHTCGRGPVKITRRDGASFACKPPRGWPER